MPVRSNPYLPSAATYGSRSVGAGTPYRGIPDIGTGLGQLAAGALGAATYDPTYDAQGQAARINKLKADDMQAYNGFVAGARPKMLDPNVPLSQIVADALGTGHVDPETAGKLELTINSMRGVQPGQTMDDALSGAGLAELAAGHSGGSTFNASTYSARKKPTEVIVDGKPQLQPAEDTTGLTPVLDESKVKGSMLANLAADAAHPMSRDEQLTATGAAPKNPEIYSYLGPNGEKGTTDNPSAFSKPGWTLYKSTVQSANPKDLTQSVETGLQNRSIEEQRFGQMLDYAQSIGDKAAESDFGFSGNTKRFVQDSMQQGKGIAQFLGVNAKDVDSAYTSAMQTAQANGIDPKQFAFDANLDKLGKIGTVLIFNAASIYANQNGRSVSDKDVQLMKKFVGDPTQLMSSKSQYLNGIDTMRDLLGMSKQTTDARLTPGAAPAAAPAAKPAAAGAVAPAAPAAGTVEDGYKFNGGDPADPKNWTPVK